MNFWLLICFVCTCHCFGFFDSFFQGDEDHHHHHQEKEDTPPPRTSEGNYFILEMKLIFYNLTDLCQTYWCKDSQECVAKPSMCSCPNPLHIKCRMKSLSGDDDWYFCTQPNQKCSALGLVDWK